LKLLGKFYGFRNLAYSLPHFQFDWTGFFHVWQERQKNHAPDLWNRINDLPLFHRQSVPDNTCWYRAVFTAIFYRNLRENRPKDFLIAKYFNGLNQVLRLK